MRSIELAKSTVVVCALFFTSTGFSQTEESPIKGRWGLSTGVVLTPYRSDILHGSLGKKLGVMPMLTYTYGKNQFEFGPQFSLYRPNDPGSYKFLGINVNYKRYFNGFGNRFVPYLYSGIAFTTVKSTTVHYAGNGIMYSTGIPYNYRQMGVNLSIGYGLEWQLGKHFYLGSAVSINPGLYSVKMYDFMGGFQGTNRTTQTNFRLDFNVNMQVGYRFGK
ncbi:hypothetical protein D3C71_974020 [compost metagenome]